MIGRVHCSSASKVGLVVFLCSRELPQVSVDVRYVRTMHCLAMMHASDHRRFVWYGNNLQLFLNCFLGRLVKHDAFLGPITFVISILRSPIRWKMIYTT